MAGVEVVDRDPIELRAEVGFELAHQVAGMAGQVFDLGSVLRRDDEAELVAIVPAAIEKGVTIGTILGRRIEPAALAIARGAIALDAAQMSSGLAAFASGANGARLDDDAAATGLAMAPAVRQVARADEGRAAPALYAPAGRDRAVPTRLAGGSAAAARDSPGGSAMLVGDLSDLGEEALGLARLRRIGANAAGPGAEAVVVIGAHQKIVTRGDALHSRRVSH
jgi:hypothetical protein